MTLFLFGLDLRLQMGRRQMALLRTARMARRSGGGAAGSLRRSSRLRRAQAQ